MPSGAQVAGTGSRKSVAQCRHIMLLPSAGRFSGSSASMAMAFRIIFASAVGTAKAHSSFSRVPVLSDANRHIERRE